MHADVQLPAPPSQKGYRISAFSVLSFMTGMLGRASTPGTLIVMGLGLFAATGGRSLVKGDAHDAEVARQVADRPE